MKTSVNARAATQGGNILVMMAVGMIVFLLLAGTVIDYGVKFHARQQLQKWVDASALAGALELINAVPAKQKAAFYYALNCSLTNPPAQQTASCTSGSVAAASCYSIGGDDVSVTTPYTKPGSSISPTNLVHVTACRTVGLFFAPMIGINSVRVCASATAKKTFTFGGIIVLDPTGQAALSMSGGAWLRLTNAAVIVDSNHQKAFTISSGSAGIDAKAISITGNYTATGGSQNNLTPTPQTGVPPTPDPLASLPAPSTSGLPRFTGVHITGGKATVYPGVYADRLSISGGAQVTFAPGIYIMQGGIDSSGGSDLFGDGIMLYNEDKLTVSGGGTVNFTPPSGGTYDGITIFQARGDTEKATLSGGSDSVLAGTYYFPDTRVLDLSGGSHMKLGSVITWRMNLSGGSWEDGPTDAPSSSSIALVD